MTFDTEKTVGGIKIRGLNYREDRGCVPWIGEYFKDSRWHICCWNSSGRYYDSGTYELDLIPLAPTVAPALDWGKPVQTEENEPLIHLGAIPRDRLGNTRVCYEPDSELFVRCREDGARSEGCDIINVPPPPPAPRTVTVELRAKEMRHGIVIDVFSEDGLANSIGFVCRSDRDANDGWQTLSLPLPEKD